MESELNKRIVEDVLKFIPKNKKPVAYLVNTLKISRESAYRRIRGDIPFTIDELMTLAIRLDFSIDSIYNYEKQNHVFRDLSQTANGATDFFLLMLGKYEELLEKIKYTKKLDAAMAFNSFPPPFYIGSLNLFKFMFYKWLYQDDEEYRNKSYSEIVLPYEAIIFQRKMKKNLIPRANVTFILDMNIFLNTIKEIHYFYQRKLLTTEEMLLLKEDTQRMIEQYEEIAQTGTYGSAKVQLYLSMLCVNSNAIYFEYGDITDLLFWVFTINPVTIHNRGIISMQRKWFNSLKRQSTLISQSNEIMQADFFSKQHEYIDKYLVVDDEK